MPQQPYDAYGMPQGKKPMGANAYYPNTYYQNQNQNQFYPKTDSKLHL